MISNFITALQFLTILPVRRKRQPDDADLARSMMFFPLVGFLLGLLLVYADRGLSFLVPHSIGNALLLLIAVLATRALHMDGLADTLDGLMGGRDRESRLAIMKDSRLGTAGALGIIFVLLLKYLSLNSLFNDGKTAALLLAPMLGRWSQTLMVFRAVYARPHGVGHAFVGRLGKGIFAAATAMTLALTLGLILFVAEVWIVVLVAGVLVFTLCARWFLTRAIGGVTGDTIGAVSELNEGLVYLLVVVIAGGGF